MRSHHSTNHGSLVGMHHSVKGAFPVLDWFTLCGNSVSKADGGEWCRVGEAPEDEVTKGGSTGSGETHGSSQFGNQGGPCLSPWSIDGCLGMAGNPISGPHL